MSETDVDEFGPIVDRLIGSIFERTLATNSLKLRFGTSVDPRGLQYIWIDPPWEFHAPSGLVTTAEDYHDYNEDDPSDWFQLFAPIESGILASWEVGEDGSVIFLFANAYSVRVPRSGDVREPEGWYTSWYAADTTA